MPESLNQRIAEICGNSPVVVMRHTPQTIDRNDYRRLFHDDHDMFNAYQSRQCRTDYIAKCKNAKFVVSFVGLDGTDSVFMGVYSIDQVYDVDDVYKARPANLESIGDVYNPDRETDTGIYKDYPAGIVMDLTRVDGFDDFEDVTLVGWNSPINWCVDCVGRDIKGYVIKGDVQPYIPATSLTAQERTKDHVTLRDQAKPRSAREAALERLLVDELRKEYPDAEVIRQKRTRMAGPPLTLGKLG